MKRHKAKLSTTYDTSYCRNMLTTIINSYEAVSSLESLLTLMQRARQDPIPAQHEIIAHEITGFRNFKAWNTPVWSSPKSDTFWTQLMQTPDLNIFDDVFGDLGTTATCIPNNRIGGSCHTVRLNNDKSSLFTGIKWFNIADNDDPFRPLTGLAFVGSDGRVLAVIHQSSVSPEHSFDYILPKYALPTQHLLLIDINNVRLLKNLIDFETVRGGQRRWAQTLYRDLLLFHRKAYISAASVIGLSWKQAYLSPYSRLGRKRLEKELEQMLDDSLYSLGRESMSKIVLSDKP